MTETHDLAWLRETLAREGEEWLLGYVERALQARDDAMALAKAAAKGGAMAELNGVAEGYELTIKRDHAGTWMAIAKDGARFTYAHCANVHPTAGEALAALIERMGDG